MKRILGLMAIGILSASAHGASPSINIGSLYEYIDSNRSNVLKRVRNTGDVTAFVRVNVTEMIYDAEGHATEVPVTTEHLGQQAGAPGNSLVASPARLIVPAKGQHATRLLYQGDRDKERYYRVRFVPVVPEKGDADFALNDAEATKYQSELSAGIQVLTGYGIVVMVRPNEAHYDVQVHDEPGAFTMRNQGNTTVSIDNFVDCGAGEKNCTDPRKIHLLPGLSQRFEKVDGHRYRFDVVEGDKSRKMQFGS
jgi:Mat/Ecp fimbriae periplasmic chaperone